MYAKRNKTFVESLKGVARQTREVCPAACWKL